MPFTKIVCTIGPSSQDPETLRAMIRNGMNVARLNFAHGSYEEHAEKVRMIRDVARELDQPVAILQDLAGPKIRVGVLPDSGLPLAVEDSLVLTTDPDDDSPEAVSVSYSHLPEDVFPGDPILLADGLMEVEVERVEGKRIHCRVVTGGVLTSHKGINLPTRSIKAPSITEKDKADLDFGLSQGVDFVGLSFVRHAEDVEELRSRMGQKPVPIIAKIEKHEAVDNMDSILAATDGIMVARGDLGVEIPLEEVPGVQKQLIRKANLLGKPVITATQMLRSMVDSPRPTRAEATDVANAVLDGTDAVMLSEETAMGSYPKTAVGYMARIARAAEKSMPPEKRMALLPTKDVSESVAAAACSLADHLEAKAIVASTVSGLTARHISRFRPACPIIALSPTPRVLRELCLYWGCRPYLVPSPESTDDLIESSASHALQTGIVKAGDIVVITAGHPVGGAGTTNILRVYKL